MTYVVPDALHDHLRGRTVAIVDDAINAGSATRATFAALRALGARPIAVGALLILGEAALPHDLWEPAACPTCAAGEPISSLSP